MNALVFLVNKEVIVNLTNGVNKKHMKALMRKSFGK
jgi:hypothetical protein